MKVPMKLLQAEDADKWTLVGRNITAINNSAVNP